MGQKVNPIGLRLGITGPGVPGGILRRIFPDLFSRITRFEGILKKRRIMQGSPR